MAEKIVKKKQTKTKMKKSSLKFGIITGIFAIILAIVQLSEAQLSFMLIMHHDTHGAAALMVCFQLFRLLAMALGLIGIYKFRYDGVLQAASGILVLGGGMSLVKLTTYLLVGTSVMLVAGAMLACVKEKKKE